MSNVRTPTKTASIRIQLDDTPLNKDVIPAPAEVSELMGRTTPVSAYSTLISKREWGKMSATYGMTFYNIQNLPSLRGREIQFDVPANQASVDIKNFLRQAVDSPTTVFKTLPRWRWQEPKATENDTANILANVVRNAVETPNIIYSFTSTLAELTTKTSGALLTQPFHYLWKNSRIADEKHPTTLKKMGSLQRAAFTVRNTLRQPYQNIQTTWDGIKKSWQTFRDDKTTPRFKKIVNGIGLSVKTVAQTVGLAVAAVAPVSWTLAIASWALGQTLALTSNALCYVRHIIDGVTTLAVNTPKALTQDPTSQTICKAAAKTIIKSTVLLLPTAAIIAAAVLIPGAQILPAATAPLLAKGIAAITAGAIGAQATNGIINYQFARANLKQAKTTALNTHHIAAQLKANPTKKLADAAKPLLSADHLASHKPQVSPAAIHQSTFVELQPSDNLQTTIRTLRDHYRVAQTTARPLTSYAILTGQPDLTTAAPQPTTGTTLHQHLHWNEYQGNAWAEYKNRDTKRPVSKIVALTAELRPNHFLLTALPNPALAPTLKAGIRALRDAGEPIDVAHLLPIVKDLALAETLARRYQEAMRQTVKNHYSHLSHDFPCDTLLDLVIRQVDGFKKMHGNHKTLTIRKTWDKSYAEAVLAYAACSNTPCVNKSPYTIPLFTTHYLDAFKDLLAQKPYLGHAAATNTTRLGEANKPAPTK